jgi:hypothetical protein
MKILLSTLAAASMSAAVASWTVPAPAYDYIVRIDKARAIGLLGLEGVG